MTQKLNVLIVEDDPISRTLIRHVVSERGHEVALCEDAEIAIVKSSQQLYPLIILDIQLPLMDGMEFCRWVRQQSWGDRTYVLVTTARNRAEDLQAVLASGADDYIPKPYDLHLLRIRLTIAERQVKAIQIRADAQKTLIESERRFSSFMSNMPGVAFIKDVQGRYTYFNEHFLSTFDSTPPEVLGKTDDELWNPETASQFKSNDAEVLEKKSPVQTIQVVPQGNRTHDWLTTKFPILDSEGAVSALAGLAVDITERRELEQLNHTILENALDAFLLLNHDGKILEVNKSYCVLSGYSREELLRMHLTDLSTDTPEILSKYIQNILILGSDHGDSVIRCKSGELLELEASINRLDGSDGKKLVCFFRNNSEKKKLAEERIKTTKLESIGLLAGGIAHEFNNVLTTIIGNISLAQTEMPESHPAAQWLAHTQPATIRASSLAKQLITFAKGGEPIRKVIHLGPVLKKSIEQVFPDNSHPLELMIARELWTAEVDGHQIGQVFENVLRNAREATPRNRKITVTAQNATLERNDLLKIPAGKYITISFADSGPGISAGAIHKVFDLYYSTKEAGRGLGLSIAYSILKKHKGAISVHSEEGVGASFTVYVPASDKGIDSTIKPPLHSGEKPNSILIMDDEEDIRMVIESMLTRAGYTVASARHGEEAIAKYKIAWDQKNPFSVVIMDLTVPDG
ncbi:MAG: putative two component system sensor histidine kinase, hybrid, partial [Verrucomicrobiales bacterium]|nr:putative two component system sensor histidine kinase, hybrid [Verrucomicrobiales bacterium]